MRNLNKGQLLLFLLCLIALFANVSCKNSSLCIVARTIDFNEGICQDASCAKVAIESLRNNKNVSEIHLCVQSEVYLNKNLAFINQRAVAVHGVSTKASGFYCTVKNIKIEFIDVHKLELKDFSVQNCEIKVIQYNFSSDLFIMSPNITARFGLYAVIVGLEVARSSGVGIEFINVNNIHVKSTNFISNTRQGMQVSMCSNVSTI